MVSTNLKNISQIGSFPQGFGVKIQKICGLPPARKKNCHQRKIPTQKKKFLVQELVLRFWDPFSGEAGIDHFSQVSSNLKCRAYSVGVWFLESYNGILQRNCCNWVSLCETTISHLVLHWFFDDLLWMVNL